MAVELVDPDPGWPKRAEEAGRELRDALPGLFSAIEHVGSTAVPGLVAKPVIDLMAAVTSLAGVVAHEDMLARLGYHRFDAGMPNRLFYRRDDAAGRRTHHLHVVTEDTWPTRNERILRDHLRAHPRDAARYGELKSELRRAGREGDDYTRAKTALIQEMVDRARVERGLPTVPVWEE